MASGDVEFLLDGADDDGADEELPEPASSSSRRRIVLAGSAAVVLLGLLVVRVDPHHGAGEPAAAPSPTAQVTRARPSTPVVAPPRPVHSVPGPTGSVSGGSPPTAESVRPSRRHHVRNGWFLGARPLVYAR